LIRRNDSLGLLRRVAKTGFACQTHQVFVIRSTRHSLSLFFRRAVREGQDEIEGERECDQNAF
jgi:hypothetical protein